MERILIAIIGLVAIFLTVRLINKNNTEDVIDTPDENPTEEIKIPESRVNNLGRNPKDPRGRR